MQMPRAQVAITPDELRRAFAQNYLAAQNSEPSGTGQSDDVDEDADPEPLPEKDVELRRRVMLLMLWMALPESAPLVNGYSLLGVPNIHQAVFDVAASTPLPKFGVPRPEPFLRAIGERLKAYSVLTGRC